MLFLTVEGNYDLEQDEFYSDLYVVKRQPEMETSDNEEEQSELDTRIENAKSVLVDNSEVSA